jgi:hypothetical protein
MVDMGNYAKISYLVRKAFLHKINLIYNGSPVTWENSI